MPELLSADVVAAFIQVILINLVLSGDNVIVIGLAAAGLAPDQRTKAIMVGIVAATVLRIVFATATTHLFEIVGLLFVGGLLLLWVCWKMWKELREPVEHGIAATETEAEFEVNADGTIAAGGRRKTLAQAATQIIVADVSMSLDNVLAVAGAAREHMVVMIFGLALSIALMGIAANYLARLLMSQRWIAYVGLAVIFYVAVEMTYRGATELEPMISSFLGS
jgi:YjbE family integral membrane protein